MAKQPRHPDPPPEPVPPPAHLSDRAKALWTSLVPRRARSPERIALLQTALEALDRADGARLVLEREGLTTKTETTGAVHVHPLAKVEKEARQLFARIWQALHLTWGEVDGRTFPS